MAHFYIQRDTLVFINLFVLRTLTADTGKCFAIETDVENFISKDHRKMSDNIIRFQAVELILQHFASRAN